MYKPIPQQRPYCSYGQEPEPAPPSPPNADDRPRKTPTDIILCPETDASPPQVARRIHHYTNLLPTAQIHVLPATKTDALDPHNRNHARAQKRLKPVFDALSARFQTPPAFDAPPPEKAPGSSSSILLHVCDKNSALQACRLLREYRTRHSTPLPIDAIIHEGPSSTRSATQLPSLTAWCLEGLPDLPRILTDAVSLAYQRLRGLDEEVAQLVRRDLLDPQLVGERGRRFYVLSGRREVLCWTRGGQDGEEVQEEGAEDREERFAWDERWCDGGATDEEDTLGRMEAGEPPEWEGDGGYFRGIAGACA